MPILLSYLLQLSWPHTAPQTLFMLLSQGLCTCGFLCQDTLCSYVCMPCSFTAFRYLLRSTQTTLYEIIPTVMPISVSCCIYFIAPFTTWHDIYLFLCCLSPTGMLALKEQGLHVFCPLLHSSHLEQCLVNSKCSENVYCMNGESQGRLIRVDVLHLWKKQDIKPRIWWGKWVLGSCIDVDMNKTNSISVSNFISFLSFVLWPLTNLTVLSNLDSWWLSVFL